MKGYVIQYLFLQHIDRIKISSPQYKPTQTTKPVAAARTMYTRSFWNSGMERRRRIVCKSACSDGVRLMLVAVRDIEKGEKIVTCHLTTNGRMETVEKIIKSI